MHPGTGNPSCHSHPDVSPADYPRNRNPHATRGHGTPGPTQTLPPEYSLTFQVTTNGRTTDPLTYVGINGGNGMNFVTDVEAILTTPDGTSQSQIMKQPHYSGQNVSFPCSTWQNRVEIWTTSPEVGRIKVYDEIVPFK